MSLDCFEGSKVCALRLCADFLEDFMNCDIAHLLAGLLFCLSTLCLGMQLSARFQPLKLLYVHSAIADPFSHYNCLGRQFSGRFALQ